MGYAVSPDHSGLSPWEHSWAQAPLVTSPELEMAFLGQELNVTALEVHRGDGVGGGALEMTSGLGVDLEKLTGAPPSQT